MTDETKNIDQIKEDLLYIKNAINKNNSLFKMISSSFLMPVLFASGLIIILLCGLSYLVIKEYGSFNQAPSIYTVGMWIIVAILLVAIGLVKLKLVTKQAKLIYNNLTIKKLFAEIYTSQTLLLILPFILTQALASIYLLSNHLNDFIVPVLAILFGLMIVTLVVIFYQKLLIVLGDWLILTGFISLFLVDKLHSLLALILTFGLGFTIMYPLYLISNKLERD